MGLFRDFHTSITPSGVRLDKCHREGEAKPNNCFTALNCERRFIGHNLARSRPVALGGRRCRKPRAPKHGGDRKGGRESRGGGRVTQLTRVPPPSAPPPPPVPFSWNWPAAAIGACWGHFYECPPAGRLCATSPTRPHEAACRCERAGRGERAAGAIKGQLDCARFKRNRVGRRALITSFVDFQRAHRHASWRAGVFASSPPDAAQRRPRHLATASASRWRAGRPLSAGQPKMSSRVVRRRRAGGRVTRTQLCQLAQAPGQFVAPRRKS